MGMRPLESSWYDHLPTGDIDDHTSVLRVMNDFLDTVDEGVAGVWAGGWTADHAFDIDYGEGVCVECRVPFDVNVNQYAYFGRGDDRLMCLECAVHLCPEPVAIPASLLEGED